MIQPASFGGYGRQKGLYGGLEGVRFASRCPPDIQKNTRIIAICGIPKEMASPQEDGWFFSDFFSILSDVLHTTYVPFQMIAFSLYIYFIHTNTNVAELPSQLWFSCCSPRKLITKHERYLHGSATGIPGDRRVVMNEKMLPENEMKAGFRVIQPKELLERFLATLRSEIREASRNKQAVMVLIFGHGEADHSGIFIGCDQEGDAILKKEMLASVLRKKSRRLWSCRRVILAAG
jgi:hypothetical protein